MSTTISIPRRRAGVLFGARRQVPLLVGVAMLVLVGVCLAAIVPSLFTGVDPNAQRIELGLTGASGAHPLGTDELGRDILARVIAGARQAVLGPLGVAGGALLLGGTIGLVAGFVGRRVDTVLMRCIDGIASLPGLLVTIVVGGLVGGGFVVAVLLLAVFFCPNDARLVRAATLELRRQGFVEAARLLGTSSPGIMVRHIVPNVVPLALANALLNFAFALVALASLSFLGIGLTPGTADWGRMLAEGRAVLAENPAAVLAPAVAIALTAASVNVLGDWAYGRLARPPGAGR